MVLLCASAATAQSKPASAPAAPGRTIYVVDAETGAPMNGVEVQNTTSGNVGHTASTGLLTVPFGDATSVTLRVRKFGYDPQTLAVTSPRDSARVTISLKRTIQPMSLQGFEERRDLGNGYFISSAQLLRRGGDTWLSDLLPRVIPGVAMVRGPGGVLNLMGKRTDDPSNDPGWCMATVYLDGMLFFARTQPGPPPAPDFGSMRSGRYAAIEYYAGESPISGLQDQPHAACGTILLWTRGR
jgi:hypothetical protein